ncbi:MAG: hypothetical protein M1831_006938 [Alyxoria varia]|nr:MAG: hypothetical protein M1831_006938 [Alyxoria varia]
MSLLKSSGHLRALASLASVISVAISLASSKPFRLALAQIFHPSAHPVRFGTLLVALWLNVKSLPLVWHVRLFKIMWYQLYFQRTKLPLIGPKYLKEEGDAASVDTSDTGHDVSRLRIPLFMPVITTGFHTPLYECDWNLHKSNSTYFADLDMARTQLVSIILRKGMRESTNHRIAMGAVSCHFKKEIKPYERFDIWTRLLSWDRKWAYFVCHIVKPGTCVPDSWALQPWHNKNKNNDNINNSSGERSHRREDTPTQTTMNGTADPKPPPEPAIYGTSIAKYVVKNGRITVPPDAVLRNSNLLPSQEGEEQELSRIIEEERLRGLAIAEHFAALDGPGGLHDEFPVAFRDGAGADANKEGFDLRKIDVLGEFRDVV